MPILNAPLPATILSILDPQDSTMDGFIIFIIGGSLCVFFLISLIHGLYNDEDYEDYEDYEDDEGETEYRYSSAESGGCEKRCMYGIIIADRKGVM